MTELGDVLPGPAGAWLLRLIVNDARVCRLVNALATSDLDRRRANGLPWPAGTQATLAALAERVDTPAVSARLSASGQPPVIVAASTGFVSASEAERITGATNVRRMCRNREVISHRLGRDWLVNLDSLRNVLARRAA